MKSLKPWYWRSLPLNHRTGSEIFAALFLQPGAIATLLESPYPPNQADEQGIIGDRTKENSPQTRLARYSICAGTPRILDGRPQLWTPPVGGILPFLKQLLQKGISSEDNAYSPAHPLPFTGGWLGWLGYDLAWEIERLPKLRADSLPFPVAYWYEPECFAVLDHGEQTLWLAATFEAQLDQLHSQLEQTKSANQQIGSSAELPPPPLLIASQADYEDAVRQAKKYIKAGDIFQANLSLRFEARTTAASWAIYQALQQINPSPFASYWQTPWGAVISCSPERLVQLQGRHCQTRPIAGTRSRGATPEQDAQLAQDLLRAQRLGASLRVGIGCRR
jgi:para-aminobenzoate synthetase component I